MRLEDLLRDVLTDVAAEAPPPDPLRAVRAERAARRRTAVLAATAVAAVVLVLAGAALVPVLRSPGPPTATRPAPTAPAPAPEPPPAAVGGAVHRPALTGPRQLTAWSNASGSVVRRPGTTDFRALPYPIATVSATGRVAVLGSTEVGRRLGIIDDLDRPTVRWVPVPVDVFAPVWSADGRRLLVTTFEADPSGTSPARNGFLVVDPDTLAATAARLPADPDTATAIGRDYQTLQWDPQGAQVVGSVSLGGDGAVQRWGVRWWRLDGTPGRTLEVPGPMSAGLSPSGRYVACSSEKGRSAVLRTDTGALVATLPGSSAQAYGWRSDDAVVTEGGQGLVLVPLAVGAVREPYADRRGPDLYQYPSLTPVG